MIAFARKLRCCCAKARADRLIRKCNETQYVEVFGKVPHYTEVKGSFSLAFGLGLPSCLPPQTADCCISGSSFPAAGACARFSQTSSGLRGRDSLERPRLKCFVPFRTLHVASNPSVKESQPILALISSEKATPKWEDN